MSNDLRDSLLRIAEKLVSLAAGDEQVRNDLHAVAKAVMQLTMPQAVALPEEDQAPEVVESATVPPVEPEAGTAPILPQAPGRPAVADLIQDLTFAIAGPPETTPVDPVAAEPPIDLAVIEKRCLLKAEAARWASQRRRRLAEGASYEIEIEPKDREILEKGKEVGTYLWMSNPAGPCPADPAAMEDAGNCFETTSSALASVRGILNDSPLNEDSLAQALPLLAEAHCMLRTAVNATGWQDDRDQSAIHAWLRGATYQHQIFIPEFMRAADVADPSGWSCLARRIDELDEKIENRRSSAKKQRNLLGKLRYHLKQIQGGGDNDYNWQRVISSVDELAALGTPPSSIELRDALLPFVECLPEKEFPSNFNLVLREIDRFLASRPEQQATPKDVVVSEDIKQVADLLRGKKVTLVGGSERQAASGAIKEAFGLKALNWVRSEEHESVNAFEPDVADPEVVLVILMIRWSSHSYGDLQKFCDKYRKPLLRLPGGYNPNQIAHQILTQASGRLNLGR